MQLTRAKQSKTLGFRGLTRNNNGDGLLGFTTCLTVKLYAIFHDLRLVYDAGNMNIILESGGS